MGLKEGLEQEQEEKNKRKTRGKDRNREKGGKVDIMMGKGLGLRKTKDESLQQLTILINLI